MLLSVLKMHKNHCARKENVLFRRNSLVMSQVTRALSLGIGLKHFYKHCCAPKPLQIITGKGV